jgi:hypothetical protein
MEFPLQIIAISIETKKKNRSEVLVVVVLRYVTTYAMGLIPG